MRSDLIAECQVNDLIIIIGTKSKQKTKNKKVFLEVQLL